MQLSELPTPALFDELKTRPGGLTGSEAAARLREHGPNELATVKRAPPAMMLIANLYHTFALLLWAAALLAFIAGMGRLGWAIIAVIIINALFSFWQEYRAGQAVAALKKMLPARARVLRDGTLNDVLARELVPGDIIVLQEGDYISADARLIEENNLRVDAAALTGESTPVRRTALPVAAAGLNASEVPNLVFAGTSVAMGSGKGIVYATAMATEFGKIAALTQKVKTALSPLQREVNRVALIIAIVALAMGAALFAVSSLFTRLTLGAAAVFAVGMLVANVPEGLLPTVTLSLAMAVKRMARENALVKRLSGVETLGSTTVICTDKTGTLTRNEMTVRRAWAGGRRYEVTGDGYEPAGAFLAGGVPVAPDELRQLETLMAAAALCNNSRLARPDGEDARWHVVGDPTEGALMVAAAKWGFDTSAAAAAGPRLFELPFESRRKRMSVIHGRCLPLHNTGVGESDSDARAGAGTATVAAGPASCYEAYAKGAPSELLPCCARILIDGAERPLSPEEVTEIERANDDLARDGLRVLALACRRIDRDSELVPDVVERDMTFLGLMAMMDPPRPEVAAAVASCHDAGIRVIMITGDYGLTAESVARRIGIIGGSPARIVNGADVERMDDDALGRILAERDVIFARVSPEHKLRIAATLRAGGDTVAMTGDGVNDAPALKQADIGVAMGVSGTDVAREAATMVLADDNFATIVAAVEEGRTVYDNMKKFLTYIFAHLTPEIMPFVAFVLFDVPLPLTVMQILAIDLGTETLPALALGVEKGEPDLMRRPPRSRRERLVDRSMLLRAWIFLGLIESALVLAGYFWVLYSGGWRWGGQLEASSHLYLQATTMTWAGIVALQIGTAFACRTNRLSAFRAGFWTNRWLLWGILFEVAFTLTVIYVPWLQRAFDTAALGWRHLLVLASFPPVIFFADELRKLLVRRSLSRTSGRGAA